MNKVDHKLTKRLNKVVIVQRNERIVCAWRSERVYFGYITIAVTNTERAAALCSVPISSAGSLLLCITPGLESFNLQRVILLILSLCAYFVWSALMFTFATGPLNAGLWERRTTLFVK